MALVEEAIYSRLQASSGVTTLVSTRTYFGMAPPNATEPYVTFNLVGGETINTHDGSSGLANVTVQLDCWDRDIDVARSVDDACRLALQGTNAYVAGVLIKIPSCNEPITTLAVDNVGRETPIKRVERDYSVWYGQEKPA